MREQWKCQDIALLEYNKDSSNKADEELSHSSNPASAIAICKTLDCRKEVATLMKCNNATNCLHHPLP